MSGCSNSTVSYTTKIKNKDTIKQYNEKKE